MIIPKQKGLFNSVYEINTSNQLNNIKTVKYGMTRSPADGVNKIEREFDQKYTDYWLAAQYLNRNISIIRGILPTNPSLPFSFSEKQLENVLNHKIASNPNPPIRNESDYKFLIYPIEGYEENVQIKPSLLNSQPWLSGDGQNTGNGWINQERYWLGRDGNTSLNTIVYRNYIGDNKPTNQQLQNDLLKELTDRLVPIRFTSNYLSNRKLIYYSSDNNYNQVLYDATLTNT